MRAVLLSIPEGRAGTLATLRVMRHLARSSAALPIVRETAVDLVRRSTPLAIESQVHHIREFLRRHVSFVRDPRHVEALHTPHWLLSTIRTEGSVQGDCDDVALLGATLGLSVGLPARFVALGRDDYEHVFAALGRPDGRQWWELDVTRPWQTVPAELQRNVLTLEV